ncbi:hypothetical protein GOP47_0013409 [Adiantum capillus-veneris]|uniref:Histone RNA hairpin-binding protein RNA-binding domain-containing protein n=1 Tax=Adiantum capillus-veneris TaxID=13818 RepID=A0A9D4UNG2_ADICA|nr:hypothetical protein GOP47_0013409 [Adiantum capillus-veneris]
MDIESLAEVRTGISADGSINMSATNSAELKGPQLPKICGLDGGLNVNLPKPVSSTDNLVQNHVRSEDIGSRLAEKLKASGNIAQAQPFSRAFVDVTNTFKIPDGPAFNGKSEEEDARRISQRQRQVDFGKNTLGYERYTELVPRCKRKQRDPQTPDPKQVCSKRSWDGQIRKWRRLLHVYDPPREHGEEEAEDFSTDRTILPKDADSKRMNASQGLSQSKYSIEKDANFTIYDDWNDCATT